MKVEIFAEGVDRHEDGWNAIVRRVANAACVTKRITQEVTHALMRDATELLEQSAVKSKVRPQHLWNRECEMPMRHDRQDRLRQHRAEHLHLFLMARRAEPTTLAGERQQAFMAALVAAHARETFGEVAALHEFVDHFWDHPGNTP